MKKNNNYSYQWNIIKSRNCLTHLSVPLHILINILSSISQFHIRRKNDNCKIIKLYCCALNGRDGSFIWIHILFFFRRVDFKLKEYIVALQSLQTLQSLHIFFLTCICKDLWVFLHNFITNKPGDISNQRLHL